MPIIIFANFIYKFLVKLGDVSEDEELLDAAVGAGAAEGDQGFLGKGVGEVEGVVDGAGVALPEFVFLVVTSKEGELEVH